MITSNLNLLSVYLNQVGAKSGVITKGVSTPSFSAMLGSIIAEQNISTQEMAEEFDTSCDCDETEKCKCDCADKEAEAVKTEKPDLMRCMDCVGRKAGTCTFWNGKEGIFDMLVEMYNGTSMDKGVSLSHRQLDFQPDFTAIAKTLLDYNNAYAYITKKQLGIMMPE